MSDQHIKGRRVLIIGRAGLVGSSVSSQLDGEDQVYGTYFKHTRPDGIQCDITDERSVMQAFEQVRPTHVFHCGNLAGGVLFCEKEPEAARKFHLDGTKNLINGCREVGARLTFISTECVFDGKKEVYKEDDDVNPISIYGRYKAASEELIREQLNDHIIARTMFVFGWQPETTTPNAVMSAYFAISNNKEIEAPTFRWGSPTYAPDLSRALIEMAFSAAQGTYHVCGNSYLNRYDWLLRVCQAAGWDSQYIKPQTQPPQGKAVYPHKIRLDTGKYHSEFTVPMKSLEVSLKGFAQEYECTHAKN